MLLNSYIAYLGKFDEEIYESFVDQNSEKCKKARKQANRKIKRKKIISRFNFNRAKRPNLNKPLKTSKSKLEPSVANQNSKKFGLKRQFGLKPVKQLEFIQNPESLSNAKKANSFKANQAHQVQNGKSAQQNPNGFSTGLDELRKQAVNQRNRRQGGPRREVSNPNRFKRGPQPQNLYNRSNAQSKHTHSGSGALAKMHKSLFPGANTRKLEHRPENHNVSRRKPFQIPKKREPDEENSKFKRRAHRAPRATPDKSTPNVTEDASEQTPLEKFAEENKLDLALVTQIEADIMDTGPGVDWGDIAGLVHVKRIIRETIIYPSLRPDIFRGVRRPARGILLFGPPGTGKTMIGKAIASQLKSTFFSISSSSLVSKWIGESEKLIKWAGR